MHTVRSRITKTFYENGKVYKPKCLLSFQTNRVLTRFLRLYICMYYFFSVTVCFWLWEKLMPEKIKAVNRIEDLHPQNSTLSLYVC